MHILVELLRSFGRCAPFAIAPKQEKGEGPSVPHAPSQWSSGLSLSMVSKLSTALSASPHIIVTQPWEYHAEARSDCGPKPPQSLRRRYQTRVRDRSARDPSAPVKRRHPVPAAPQCARTGALEQASPTSGACQWSIAQSKDPRRSSHKQDRSSCPFRLPFRTAPELHAPRVNAAWTGPAEKIVTLQLFGWLLICPFNFGELKSGSDRADDVAPPPCPEARICLPACRQTSLPRDDCSRRIQSVVR